MDAIFEMKKVWNRGNFTKGKDDYMIKRVTAGRAYIFNTSMNIVFRVVLSPSPDIETLKMAIIHAVQKFDALNCRVLEDDDGNYFFVKEREYIIPKIDVRNYKKSAEEFINEQERIFFDFEQGELVRFVLEVEDGKTTLNIIQHHLAGDGKSVLILLEQIMYNIQKGKKDKESVEENIPIQILMPKYIKQFVQVNPLLELSIGRINEKWNKTHTGIYTQQDLHRLFSEYWAERKTKVLSASISLSKIEAFVNKCKLEEVSVNNTLIACAFRRLKANSKINIAVDARTEEYFGFGNYSSSINLENIYDTSIGFWENAKKIQQFITSCIGDRKQLLLSFLVGGMLEPTLVDGSYFQQVGKMDNSVVAEYLDMVGLNSDRNALIVSNLGKDVLENCCEEYDIDEISFFSPVSIGFGANLSVVTHNNTIVINLQYYDSDIDYKGIFTDIISLVTADEKVKLEDEVVLV